MKFRFSFISSGATKDIDWLGPQGLDLHGIKERGNESITLCQVSIFIDTLI